MQVIIDRFEADMAVCQKPDRTTMNIPRRQLPQGAREGDALIIEGEQISLDVSATSRRRQKIERVMKDLWK
jgi:hypothetical protein